MSKKNIKASKKSIGDLSFKLSLDTAQFDSDLERIIKKLKKIQGLFLLINLKYKADVLLSYVGLKRKKEEK